MKGRATGDLQFVQQMNRKLVLETLLNRAPLSRVDIARATTLSPTTVTNAIAALTEEGLVHEIGSGPSAVGRRPILLDVCWDARTVIGLGVLDNRLVGVRTNLKADVQAKRVVPLGAGADLTEMARGMVDELLAGQDRAKVLGIGISTPGILDRDAGDIESSANFPWKRLNLGGELQRHTGIPTTLENDTNAAALGERYFGKGLGVTSFAYVYVGTGIGAGIVVDGKLVLGNHGNAGEIGHMTINWRGKQCTCGSRGCLECYVSWKAVVDLVANDDELSAAYPQAVAITTDRSEFVRDLYQYPTAASALNESARILGAGIASLVVVTDPELVIVEGLYRLCEEFMELLTNEASLRLTNVTHSLPEITRGMLGEDASVMGAVAVVLGQSGFLRTEFPQTSTMQALPQGG